MIKKVIVGLMAVAMLFAMTGLALAAQDNGSGYVTSGYTAGLKGNITANLYNLDKTTWTDGWGNTLNKPAKDWNEKVQGQNISGGPFNPFLLSPYGQPISTHLYGTWNSPYTFGVDGYNYNDAQDYTTDGDQTTTPAGKVIYQSGPHGGYLTTTHRCRECHAVHRAAGKFKLLRSDTRFEACDWCHGTGAGSGFNIQMDNDDNYTTEYNVGHTMGFGISSGKWKAPDDTYPAYTPNYWMGGFSCFDCHSPHANPQRLLGYNDQGQVKGLAWADARYTPPYYNGETRYYSIVNPGHGSVTDPPGASIKCIDCHKKTLDGNGNFATGYYTSVPLYLSGSWLLVKDADREIATTSETIAYYKIGDAEGEAGSIETTSIALGTEISDMIFAYSELINGESSVTAGLLHQYDTNKAYPVNKIPIDWNSPIGIAKLPGGSDAYTVRSYLQSVPNHTGVWNINEFCSDCHDGNVGLHTVAAPLFSEDRALRDQTQTGGSGGTLEATSNPIATDATQWKGEYDIAYGHDENSRHCGRQMQFNPEDLAVFGPHCRNCHKGSSSCGRCHSESSGLSNKPQKAIYTSNLNYAANNNLDRLPARYEQAYDQWGNPIPSVFITIDEYPTNIGQGQTTYHVKQTSTGEVNMVFDYNFAPHADDPDNKNHSYTYEKSRTVSWDPNWRTSVSPNNSSCSDDGFSWPHRTLGWKLLKDDLFGLNFDGTPVGVGQTRSYDTNGDGTPETYAVHDLDSVCLDCHNPTVWRATSSSHTDTAGTTTDDFNDELLLRGLP